MSNELPQGFQDLTSKNISKKAHKLVSILFTGKCSTGRIKTLRKQNVKYEYTQHIQWQEKIGKKWRDVPGATDDILNVQNNRPVRAYITYTRSRIFAT